MANYTRFNTIYYARFDHLDLILFTLSLNYFSRADGGGYAMILAVP